MRLLAALAYGLPDFSGIGTITIVAAAASGFLGLWSRTYDETIRTAGALALGWFVLMMLIVPVALDRVVVTLCLVFVGGFLGIALAAHALRRLNKQPPNP
jgi:hypothetical protein